jgi:hypothetical protein
MNKHSEKVATVDGMSVALGAAGEMREALEAHGFYTVQCHEYEGGPLLWEDRIENLVTTVGKNAMLDNHLSGSAYTAAWYMGLMSLTSYTTGPAAGDTMASHGGWAEDQNYSQGARPTSAWSAASAGAKALSAALVFTMNATTTIKGCFLNSIATKGGTTGTLFSAGLFTGGDQPVVSGNTLSVSYSASV